MTKEPPLTDGAPFERIVSNAFLCGCSPSAGAVLLHGGLAIQGRGFCSLTLLPEAGKCWA